ncbi:MAG: cytochrome c, partial [Candidatus Aminicenantes bacterium]|nr:cytochrome c [Candidatus Aminicenantes bacterium]
MKKVTIVAATAALAAVLCVSFGAFGAPAKLSPMEELGKKLFFDKSLSSPAGQECAVCHGPAVGFTGPDEHFNKLGGVYEGAVKGRFGNRKPPAAAYAGWNPKLHIDANGQFVGGMFWDGRAKRSAYAGLFEQVFGAGSLDAEKDPEGTYAKIGRAIAAYERSAELNPFSSKFDGFWRAAKAKGLEVEAIGEANIKDFRNLGLNDSELTGLMVFNTKGLCAKCHVLT